MKKLLPIIFLNILFIANANAVEAYDVEITGLMPPSLTTGEFMFTFDAPSGTSTCIVGDDPPTIKVQDSANNAIYSTILAMRISGKKIKTLSYAWNNDELACIFSNMKF